MESQGPDQEHHFPSPTHLVPVYLGFIGLPQGQGPDWATQTDLRLVFSYRVSQASRASLDSLVPPERR